MPPLCGRKRTCLFSLGVLFHFCLFVNINIKVHADIKQCDSDTDISESSDLFSAVALVLLQMLSTRLCMHSYVCIS